MVQSNGISSGNRKDVAGTPAAGLMRLRASVQVLLLVALAIPAGLLLTRLLPAHNVPFVFLVAVLLAAVLQGVLAGVLAAGLSFLAYNFFFIAPTYTFTVADPQEVFALLVFLMVGVLTGSLAGRMQEQAGAARRWAETVQGLYEFAGRLSAATSREALFQTVGQQLHTTLGLQTVTLLRSGAELRINGAWPGTVDLDPSDWQAAAWALRSNRTAARAADFGPDARFEFHPVSTSAGPAGVVGVAGPQHGPPLEYDQVIGAVLRHAAIALERIELTDETAAARAEAEQEQIRSAMLSSLSHDLRTPLAAILGAVTSLRQFGDKLPPTDQEDLLSTIEDETRRLSRFVANLLDMTKLEAGALEARQDWIDLPDAIRAAVRRARSVHPHAAFLQEFGNLAPLRGDASLVEQALFNILDNAAKFSGEGHVRVVANAAGDDAEIVVTDDGPGIHAADIDRIFIKFQRSAQGDRTVAGTGLGLAISRGMIEAMGGTVHAETPPDGRGARIVIRLPMEAGATGGQTP